MTAGARAAADPWQLELPGRSLALAPGETTLGRSRGCGIVLADPCVSRVHAVVSVRPDGAFLEDLRSSNGTYLNGQRVLAESPLEDGDRIEIGHFELVVHRADSAAAVPATPGDLDADAEGSATHEMDRAEPLHPLARPSLLQRLSNRLRL